MGVKSRSAPGVDFEVKSVVVNVEFPLGTLYSQHDFLVAQVPYRPILAEDWLYKERVQRCFEKGTILAKRGSDKYVVKCERHLGVEKGLSEKLPQGKEDRDAAAQAHKQIVIDVAKLNEEQSKQTVRPAPRPFKYSKNKRKLVPTKQILRDIKLRQEKGELDAREHLCLIDAKHVPQRVIQQAVCGLVSPSDGESEGTRQWEIRRA